MYSRCDEKIIYLFAHENHLSTFSFMFSKRYTSEELADMHLVYGKDREAAKMYFRIGSSLIIHLSQPFIDVFQNVENLSGL
jgi:hypothetical protein